MKPLKDIKQYFKKATLSTNPDKHEAIFKKILSAHKQVNEREPESSRINLGRFIMKSPIIKLTTAAMIVIACMIGMVMLDRTSSVALADVLTQIKEVSAFVYHADMTTTTQMTGRETSQDVYLTIWMSRDYGWRMDMEMSNSIDPNAQTSILTQNYILPEKNEIITIMPAQKQYLRGEFNEEEALQTRQSGYDPNLIVEQFLESEYINLGRTTIDGIEVEGFQLSDPNSLGGLFGSSQTDIKLWVDVKTQLPVQMEMNLQTEEQISITMSGVIYGFQWDIPVDAAIFEPVIPEDYSPFTSAPIQMSYEEDTAIKGLRLFADQYGQYPKELNLLGMSSQMSELREKMEKSGTLTPSLKQLDQLEEQSKKLNDEEMKQQFMDIFMDFMMSITGLSTFYTQLEQENKDPAYYGDIVSPGDADNVLMRWKVSDFDYRVIFGDLKAETVSFETLVQLESTLPDKEESEN